MRSLRAAGALSAWLFLTAASPAEVSLRDVLATAMRTNPDLQQASADFDAARGRALAAEGIDDFVLDATVTARQDKTALLEGSPFQQPQHRALGFDVGLTKPLPTGGSLGLRFTTDYSKDEFAQLQGMETVFTDSIGYNPSVQLVLNHSLLRGIGAGTARAERRRTSVARDAARLSRENAAAVVLRDVAGAYWEVRFAAEVVAVQRQLAASARDQLEQVDANIKAGKLPPSARAEVLVAQGLRDEQALIAERSLLERSLELRVLAGMPITAADTMIVAKDSLEASAETESLENALALAAQRNPALLSAQATGRAARVDVDVTQNGLLPQLDLNVIAGPTGSSSEAKDAFEQLGKFDSYTVQASLVFTQPLGNRDARGKALAARATWRRATLDADEIAAQTSQAVVRAHALTEEGRRRLEVIAPTTEAASLDLAAEKARFEVGRATNFDVLRRQEELAQTQLRQARARADLLRARAALWATTGEIFDRFGIKVQ
jgi:outer membrane protein TolC